MPKTTNGTSNTKSKSSSSSSTTKRLAILAALVAVGFAIAQKINVKRVKNTIRGLYLLGTMPESDWDAYYKSLDVMAKPMLETKEDELAVGSWYKVINLLCDLGELEKMYFPPLVDPTLGLVDNQILVENKMALSAASYEWDPLYINKVGDKLPETLKKRYVVNDETGEKTILPVNGPIPAKHSVRPMDILDLGCGKGRIAHDMMVYTDGKVKGLNIDVTQLQNAMRFALEQDLWPEKLDFRHGSFNDPLPYPDESFDYVYEVGAFTYLIDKVAVFKEIYRVLRPGGAFVYQDWTDTGYNPNNKTQAEMILKVKLISGLIELHNPKELADVARKAGFEVLFNDDGGYKAEVSSKLCTVKSFKFVDTFMNPLIKYKILPPRMVKAWRTMRTLGIHQLRYSIDEGLLNMGHVFLIRKPMK